MESRRRVALITGANRGVGKGIALAFAEKGYDLFLAHYGEPKKAQEVIEEIQKRFGREVHTYDCNLAVAAEVEDLFRAAVDAYGEIDVLMSNAGVGLEKYLTYTTIREMDNIYQTNYRAGIYLATMVANHMKEKKIRGSILFTASTRGSFEVHPDDALYGGMKAALHRSAQSLAREFAPYGLNKPIVCSDGEWLFPVALWKRFPSAFNPDQPRALSNVYSSSDHGKTFQYKGGIAIPGRYYDESVLVERKNGLLWMLVRCEDGVGQAFSKDGGKIWENPGKSDIPGPNSRFQVMRLRSGNLLMVNHQPENGLYRPNPDEEFFYIRSQLTAYLSCDDGKTWSKQLLLDERDGVSYPDVAQDDNGDIYIIYDYNRYKDMEILMAVIRETDDNGLEAKQLKVVVDKPY